MGTSSEEFLSRLSEQSRVLLLGGLAVIAHGMSRTTEDADVWMDSMLPLKVWLKLLEKNLPDGSYCWDLLHRRQISGEALVAAIEDLGVVRIGGLDRYVDVFRRPNELAEEDFAAAWEASRPHVGRFRLLDETFLIVTKENSERERDRIDISFLESKLRERYAARLAVCDAEEASGLFARYVDHATCQAALGNSDPAVREIGLAGLRELAADGNPFAIAALKKLE
jgi:hypothetical protein